MKELLRQGIPVRRVNRSGQAPVPDSVEVVAGDLPTLPGIRRRLSVCPTSLYPTETLYLYGPVQGSLYEKLPYAATTRKGRT